MRLRSCSLVGNVDLKHSNKPSYMLFSQLKHSNKPSYMLVSQKSGSLNTVEA